MILNNLLSGGVNQNLTNLSKFEEEMYYILEQLWGGNSRATAPLTDH